jgi:hypothetical protein
LSPVNCGTVIRGICVARVYTEFPLHSDWQSDG